MRPSSSPFTHPSGLVDKRLGNMWAQIEEVRTYLPQIAHVSYYLESLFNLDRNLTLLSDENVDHHILKDITIFQGASAYELALVEGFEGTVSEWIASLKGDKGDTGLLDEVAHQILIDGIASNAAAAAAAQAAADANALAQNDYVLQTTFDARTAAVDAVLDALETTIVDTVTPLLPTVRTDTEINDLAQAAIDTALTAVNSAISNVEDILDTVGVDIDSLQTGLANTNTTFGSFLIDYGEALTRIDVLEASSGDYNSAIVDLQSVTADSATAITALQATSSTYASEISDLQTVTGNAATQINALQVANNANNLSITNLETAYVAGDEAVVAAVQTLSLRTDLGLIGSSNILPNWDLRATDGDGKPLGIRGVDSANTAARENYLTHIETGGMRIDGSVDSTLAFGFPAIPIDEKITYKIIVKHKSSAFSAKGLYILMNERSTALEPGTTHIGSGTGESDVSPRASVKSLVANGAMPGTTLVTSEYDYIPTPGTWLASLSFYNWSGFSGDYEIISVQIIPRSNVIYDYVDAEILSEASIRSSADSTQVSSINSLSLSLGTLEGTVTTQASVIANISGNLASRFAIAVDGGGNGSFISLEDGVSVPSQIEISASLIKLSGTVLINGTLATEKVEDDAITERLITTDSSTRALPTTATYGTIESVVYNKQISGSAIEIKFHVKCRTTSNSNLWGGFVKILRNGVQVGGAEFAHLLEGLYRHSLFGSIVVSGVPTGNSTWALQMKAERGVGGGTGVTDANCNFSQFSIEEIKK